MILDDLKNRIYADFVASFTNAITPLKKTFFEVISNAHASVSNLLYLYLDNVQDNSFLNSCSQTRVLSYFAPLNRLSLKSATYAEGILTFTGTVGALIPLGTKVVYNNTSLEYQTTVVATIPLSGTIDVPAIASSTNLGSQGNTLGNIDLTVSTPLSGVNSDVKSTLGFTKGIDAESVESLRTRCMIKQGDSPNIDNRNYYRTLGNQLPNIKATFVTDLKNGNGTFGITILTHSNNGIPTPTDLSDLALHLETLKAVPTYAAVDIFQPVIVYVNLQILLAIKNDVNIASTEKLARDYIYLYQRAGQNFNYIGLSKLLQNNGARLVSPIPSFETTLAVNEVLDIGGITWL